MFFCMNVVVLCILIQAIAISMVLKRQQDGQKLFKGTCAGHGELSCCHSRDTRHSCQKCPEERSCNEHSRYHTLGGIGLALTTIGTSQHKPKHSLQEEFEKFIIKSVESNQSLIFFYKKNQPSEFNIYTYLRGWVTLHQALDHLEHKTIFGMNGDQEIKL
jgi:hypothetical protein